MKFALTIALTFSSFIGLAQNMHKLSLSEEQLMLEDWKFNIVQVIDGREEKMSIGWVQTGLFNNKRWADFEQPLETEITDFLRRNLDSSATYPPVLIRVNHLSISEQTKATTETAKAELSLDFFLQDHDGHYLFISSTYGTTEKGGLDVTGKHPGNIAEAFSQALQQFNEKGGIALVNQQEQFSLNELINGAMIEIDLNQIAIFNAPTLKDGIYVSFEDFRDHKPTITQDYMVKEGNKVKVWQINRAKNSRERIREGVYAVVENNQAYILFHKAFYPLRKDDYGFYFTGPHIPDQGAVTTGAILGGAIGGAIAASASGGKKDYAIDLGNGAIIEIGDTVR